MCLAIPMQLKERDDVSGVVELKGVRRHVSLMLYPEAQVGDHLLIHAGFAIGAVDAEEAAETVRLFEEMRAAEERQAAHATEAPPEPEPKPEWESEPDPEPEP